MPIATAPRGGRGARGKGEGGHGVWSDSSCGVECILYTYRYRYRYRSLTFELTSSLLALPPFVPSSFSP